MEEETGHPVSSNVGCHDWLALTERDLAPHTGFVHAGFI